MKITRRDAIGLLIGAGAIGAACKAFTGAPKYTAKIDVSFIGQAEENEPFISCEPVSQLNSAEVPQEVLAFAKQTINENWKKEWIQEWAARGGTQKGKLELERATSQMYVVPESNSAVAESYRAYCERMVAETLNSMCSSTQLKIRSASPDQQMTNDIAWIVNMIGTHYTIFFAATEEGIKPLQGGVNAYAKGNKLSPAGERVVQINSNGENRKVAYGPLALSVAQDKPTVLFNPIVEAAHEALLKALHERFRTESDPAVRIKSALVNEGVAHAIGFAVFEALVRKYELPMTPYEIAECHNFQKGQDTYVKLGSAAKLVEKEGVAGLAKRYNSDIRSVEKDLGN